VKGLAKVGDQSGTAAQSVWLLHKQMNGGMNEQTKLHKRMENRAVEYINEHSHEISNSVNKQVSESLGT